MLTFDYLGVPLTAQKIVPGNTATGLATDVAIYTEHTAAFTSGGTSEITAGAWLVGATSGKTCEVISVAVTSGTWGAGTAAGTLRVKNKTGTFTVAEALKLGADADVATLTADFLADTATYSYKGKSASAALVTCSGNTALFNMDGGKPDQTALVGHDIPANGSYILTDPKAIRNFKVIDRVAASPSTVNVTLFFARKGDMPQRLSAT